MLYDGLLTVCTIISSQKKTLDLQSWAKKSYSGDNHILHWSADLPYPSANGSRESQCVCCPLIYAGGNDKYVNIAVAGVTISGSNSVPV